VDQDLLIFVFFRCFERALRALRLLSSAEDNNSHSKPKRLNGISFQGQLLSPLMNTSSLIQKVWNFCHTLRDDGVGYGDYLEQLTCLRYVQREFMTNSSLRERFGIDTKNSATASRLIKEALGAGMVRLHDPDAAPKLRRYVPSWA